MVKKEKEKKEIVEKKGSSLFDKAFDLLQDEHGAKVIESLTSLKSRPIAGLSSGSLALDWAISPNAGGMEQGKIIELYGGFSSGKTTISLGFCANATANGKKVVFIDAERTLQAQLALNAGINPKLFYILNHIDGRVTANSAEKLLKTGEVGILVIDSLPAWKPLVDPKQGEDESDFTKPKMAFSSSFLSSALPHLAQIASDHGVIVICINQIRNNLGSHAGGVQPFGGHSLDHTLGTRIRLTGKAKNNNDKIVDSDGNLVGQSTTAFVEKNKISIPLREVKVPIFLGKGVNPYMELTTLSVQAGIVDGAAGRFKWADSGENIAHGANSFAQKLFDDQDLYMDLRGRVITSLGIKYAPGVKVVNAFHDEKGEKRSHSAVIVPNVENEPDE